MALTKSDTKLVSQLADSGIHAGEVLWRATVRAVACAYGGQDGGEMARAVFSNALPAFKGAVLRRFRECGLQMDRKVENSLNIADTIGGALDPKKQNEMLAKAKATPPVSLSDEGEKMRGTRGPLKKRELKGFAKDRADKRLSGLISSLKKSDPDAAQILNDRMTKAEVTTHLQPLVDCKPTDEEIKALVEHLVMMRIEAAAKSTPANVELAIAA